MADAKERFAVWRTALEVGQRGVGHGGAVTSCAKNHMVFLGAPGTGKRTFARVVGEVLFGVGTTTRPQITEVAADDLIVGGDLLRSAARMKDVCDQARGGVLFLDEAHRLVPDTEDHFLGVDAITTLQACMAAYRDELVVIVVGYPGPMREFLAAHAGLAGRFPVTVTFASYTPEDVVALGRRLAGKESLVVEDAGWELLRAEAARLRSIPYGSGTLLDVAGNARYVREVIVACRGARVRRLHRCAPSPRDLRHLVRTDPGVLNVSATDMGRAIAASRPAAGTSAYRRLSQSTQIQARNTFRQPDTRDSDHDDGDDADLAKYR
ncbi:AAA family ATPase [Mycobacterium malmoense]|uniref:AAA family ATPase n=1 Tax=Mycobacterium malmoense TaxID=1780 RepID=UPI00210EC934|nr:AAA family ATPase [Mycobacterium malmoense]